MEIWKDIQGYEGYQISNYGNVKSLKYGKEKILTPTINKRGYYHTVLRKDGKSITVNIHRLVASAFIENPDNLPIINHKDENKTNNKAENLEWCDYKYNANYGTAIQRMIANTDYKAIAVKNGKKVLCIETGVVYPSTMEVQRKLGFASSNISSVCLGKYKQAYGYTWKYVQ